MVLETVRRARSRILVNEVARQGAFAFSAALASLILLLLLGTQILNWTWLAVLPAVTLGAGAVLTWRRMPSLYAVAQRVDHRLSIPDTLSTALFFAGQERGISPEARRVQRSQAERAAAAADVRRAIPIRVPRAIYGTAILGLIASSLFALRYGFDRRLDLQPPLARIIQNRLGLGQPAQSTRQRKTPQNPPTTPRDITEIASEQDQRGPGELDAARDSALDTVDVPDVDNNKKGAGQPQGSRQAQSQKTDSASEEEQDEPEGVSASAGKVQSQEGRQGPGSGKQGQGSDKQGSGNSGENSSLLGKFRDAMSSLLSRMRQQKGAAGAQQQAPSSQSGRQSENDAGEGRQGGKQSRQAGNGQQGEGQDGQPGDESQNAQNAQPKSSGENGQEPSTKQPGSGIGRQDGSKDVKLAEQLAAMGKISEIIGKRSANVTGEVTVEVQTSNPQLHTPYAARDTRHTASGAEISRDEVPVALQAYVQQYFEQVRKLAPENRSRHKPEPAKTPGF